ncbi:MAG: 2-phospho-L-lactate guanylyltransferase [Solirubrobacterales bacterium]|nr:MAG: 2-phospho-L-lactate guanylyltransferase [Solirubrobacterales bacterium]
MLTVAILPVKSFAVAKRRLRDELAPDLRRELAEAMLADVLVALHRAQGVGQIVVVTQEPRACRLAGEHGAVILDDEGERGHNVAASLGIDYALRSGSDRVLLVPGDCPLLDPAQLDELLARAGDPGARSVVIVPDRHGTGTNALLLTPPGSLRPSFGPSSCHRHASDARAAGTAHAVVDVPSLALDVDTPDDLAALKATLAASLAGAPHTRGVLVPATALC